MFKSIQYRICVIFVLMVMFAEALAGISVIVGTRISYHNSYEKGLYELFSEDTKSSLKEAAVHVSTRENPENPGEIIMVENEAENIDIIKNSVMSSTLFRTNSGLNLTVLNGEGEVKYSSSDEPNSDSPCIDTALKGDECLKNKAFGGEIEYALPLKSGDTIKYVIYISNPLAEQTALTKRLITIFAILLPISAIVGIIFAHIIAKSVSAPLRSLTDNAKKLADGDTSALSHAQGKDEISELTNALLYLSDSKREHADEAMAEKTKLEAILQNMSDGIMAFDTNGKLTHINPEAKKLLNRKFVDDIRFNKFFKEINTDVTLESLQYSPADTPTEREIRINNHVLQLNFARVKQAGGDGGFIVIIHDITKHEMLESARREFVANVSHELRTPITVIKSYADILSDTPDADPQTRTRFLDTISSETDRMAKIISDLLTLSSLDENTNYTRPHEDIDIRSMLEGLVDRLMLTAKKKEQTLVYTPINDVPTIRGDRDALERVFTNIISNALKYTPTGGKIGIFTSQMYNDIVIKVSDTGIGISKEQLPNIFDRFYRVDKARSRDKGGTGLGLAIAKQTVETAFHGKILISSELNKGTDVTVTIPIPKK